MKAAAVALLLGLVVTCGAQDETLLPTIEATTVPMPTTDEPEAASYWVTFNTNIRPGQVMVFNVLIIHGSSPVTVKAALMDARGETVILESPETTCTPGILEVIPIDVPLNVKKPSSNSWGKYVVRVIGEGVEVSFTKNGSAILQQKAFSTFIQTDKAMYKPKQEVKFRVLSVDPNLQVMRDAKYDIAVKDAKHNRILHLRNVSASHDLGVVQSSFRLANNIPTGDWSIEVTVMGFEEVKTFVVSDYILPKFEVEIDAPEFGISNDTHLNFTVKAKYTFGKPVSDSPVMVDVRGLDYDWMYRYENAKPRPSVYVEGKLDRDGQYQVSIPMKRLVKLVQDYRKDKKDTEFQRFLINATVKEGRTHKQQHAEHELQYFATPLKMEFLEITPKSYKAGLNFTAYLEVRKRDGSLFTPEEARKIKIKFDVTYDVKSDPPTISPTTPLPEPSADPDSTDIPLEERPVAGIGIMPQPDYRYITKNLTLPEDVKVQNLPDNGWLVIRFGIPSSAVRFRIHAESDAPFNKTDHAYFNGQPANSPTNSFLQLNVTDHKPKVNKSITVEAKATEEIKVLFYQITAKGILIRSQTVTPPNPSKKLRFEVPVESAMSPNFNLLAFMVTDNGEFVVDALSLSAEGLFVNAVEVKFSKERVQPGEAVDVVVKGKENSMVFLLAVDKSVKLLKSGNDITQELVRQELLKYEYGDNYGPWPFMFRCGWPSYVSGTDADSVLSSAGVQVLTDGLVYKKPYFGGWPDMIFFMSGRGGEMADAMPMASQPRAGPPGSTLGTKTRTIFPENWLWSALMTSSNGEASVSLSAPDTITSWVASAFSSHPTDGLSVAAEPAEVITFKDLFLSLDLPSFMVRHEVFCFTASVFNYYNKAINVWVTMEKSSDFSGLFTTKVDKIVKVEKESNNYNVILGKMKEGDIRAAQFCITPLVLGTITVQVTANSTMPGLVDIVQHKLRVKPEGVSRSTTQPYLIRLQNGQWSEVVPISFPPNTVPGSGKITINVAGNFLASVFENMDNLVRLPSGCGEQNMINFAPLISLLKFFTVSNKLTPKMETKILDFMAQGYQREMLYEHDGGGYSAFGKNGGDKPSTWLTAFVVRCFAQAHQLDTPFTAVDVITRSAIWLSKMNREGAFVEVGKVFNKKLQGGSGAGYALTAYSVIALHEAAKAIGPNSNTYASILSSRDMGISYLESSSLDQLKDPYDVCITAYALHLVDSKDKNSIFNRMEDLANTSRPGLKYWERKEEKPTRTYTTALSIEMTSYALLTYVKRGIATSGGGPDVVNWLSQQKDSKGGFISTQDTVIGIEALASFLTEAQYIHMNISVTAGQHSKTFALNKDNEMVLQKFEVPEGPITYDVSLQAFAKDSTENSPTTVLVEVAQDYNVEEETESDEYKITQSLVDGTLFITIQTIDGQMSGMALLKIDLPAGYAVRVEQVRANNKMVSKVEWEKDDFLSLYFHTDVIGPRPTMVRVPLLPDNGVMPTTLPKSIQLKSYYEPGSDATASYNLPEAEQPFCKVVSRFGLCSFPNQENIIT